MELKEALQKSLKTDKRTHSDPFLLHSRVCDLVGNDFEAKKVAEEFYRLDAKYEISKTILGAAPVRYKKRKKHYYKIKHMPLPPDNAYVYFNEDSSTLHLSGECPCLKETSQIYRTTYDHAKMLDFKKKHLHNSSWFYKMRHLGSIARLSRLHKPHICRVCGNFKTKNANGIFYKFAKWVSYRTHIDIHRKMNYNPTSFELFRAWLKKKKENLMKLFLYRKVKKYVDMEETVNTSKLQRRFNIGYAKAANMMDRLEADGKIKFANGKWYVLGGVRLKEAKDITEDTDLPDETVEFTEENVLKLFTYYGAISESLIQRRFSVGYGRAAKMIDILAEKGYIKHVGQRWVEV
jgi:ribosomal protein S25